MERIVIWVLCLMLIGVLYFITRHIRKLEVEKNHDSLTKLLNRRGLAELVGKGAAIKAPTSVVFVDLMRFKSINDNYGHEVGDSALKVLAKILSRSVRERDTVIRYGGDEFVIIFPEVGESAVNSIHKRMKQIEHELAEMPIEGYEGHVEISYGVATSQCRVSLDRMIREADDLMYQDKEKRKTQILSVRKGA